MEEDLQKDQQVLKYDSQVYFCQIQLVWFLDPTKDGSPGPDPSILQFVYEREVALFGSDTSNDIQPALYSQLKHPVHVVSLVALGVYLLGKWNCLFRLEKNTKDIVTNQIMQI